MSDCNNNCGSCAQSCSSRKAPQMPQKEMPQHGNIKKVIGIVSGKGGVGKSMTSALMSVLMCKKGYKTAILDADITGPSIPRLFGIHERAVSNEQGIFPAVTKTGIRLMSINLLLEQETDPVVWRGPVIAGVIKQFWRDVFWEDIDFMFIDMPPGTGDVPLTVFQTLPVDGIIVVASPQELVGMIVEKAVKMANLMNVPIIGLVENMSYIECPDCGKKIQVFGESHLDEIAKRYELPILARCPINPALANMADTGTIEQANTDILEEAAKALEQ